MSNFVYKKMYFTFFKIKIAYKKYVSQYILFFMLSIFYGPQDSAFLFNKRFVCFPQEKAKYDNQNSTVLAGKEKSHFLAESLHRCS